MAEGVVKNKGGRPKGSKKKGTEKQRYTVSEKAIIARRNNSPMTCKEPETEEEKAYNARQIEHITKVYEIGTMADRSDPVSLRSCFLAYLKLCQDDGFKVSNLSAYAAMGLTKESFFFLKKRPEYKELAEFVTTVCAMSRENLISDGKINPVIGIFWQRNFDGLRNDTEQVQAINEQEDEYAQFGGTSYKDRYRNLIGGSKE